MSDKIQRKEVGSTQIQVYQDEFDRFKTTVARVENLESNQLYCGYDKETAIEVYNECLERFNIDEVDSLDEIMWSS